MTYQKKVWEDGMVIDKDSLNGIENGIEQMNYHKHNHITIKDKALGDNDDEEFEIVKEDKNLVIKERGFDPQGNIVHTSDNIIVPHSQGAIAINRDVNIQGDVKIPPSCLYKAGSVDSELWSGFESYRMCGGKKISSKYGTGMYDGNGYTIMLYQDNTNELDVKQQRLFLGNDALFPESNGKLDLGLPSQRFKDGHFGGVVRMGSNSTIESLNGRGVLKFEDNNTLVGTIGKSFADSKDFAISPAAGENVRLQNNAEGKAQLGTQTFGVEIYQGSKTWYFAPYGTVNFLLGTSTNRFGMLSTTVAPNVSSDKSLKGNIKYIATNKVQQTDSELKNNASTSDVSTLDMYEFVKQDLNLAEYTYINSQQTIDTMGFIAQDVVESNQKVSDKFIRTDENGLLSYDMGAYISVLAGALQEATNKITLLEARLTALESK